jgi:glycerol-3-phosphate dehydrogenase
MPLHEAVYRILYEGLAPRQAMAQLTSRELKSEFSMH